MIATEPQPNFLLDWQAAELAALEHMKSLGFLDAQKTKSGADGGIDVASSDAAAQVKFHANPVGRPDIQRLRGAAHEYRIALFYSTGGYTNEAVHYANNASVALFVMDPYGRSETASEFAALLTDSNLTQERKEHFEELTAERYGFAADSLDRDLQLYKNFAKIVSLTPDESAIYTNLNLSLEQYIREFRRAAESKRFVTADNAFEEVQKRIGFLAWITSSDLRAAYENLEEAIASGWEWEASPGSEHLLQRVGSGAFKLRDLIAESFQEWSELFPEGVTVETLSDTQLPKYAGMLISASVDPEILPRELIEQLKAGVRAEVKRTHAAATDVFRRIFEDHARFNVPQPRSLVARSLRLDSLVNRIYQQLDASIAA